MRRSSSEWNSIIVSNNQLVIKTYLSHPEQWRHVFVEFPFRLMKWLGVADVIY